MLESKQMPYHEKLASILSYDKLVESFAPQLIKKELGDKKLIELKTSWKEGIQTIPEDAPDEDKYEIAYRNFMWKWASANTVMDETHGDDSTAKYMREAIAAWKRKYAPYAFALKNCRRCIAQTSFRLLAKRLVYQLQVFSPFAVTEITKNRMVLTVTPCKILTDRTGSSFCSMACQNIIPSWLQAQFDVKMNLNRLGANCMVIFEPFRS